MKCLICSAEMVNGFAINSATLEDGALRGPMPMANHKTIALMPCLKCPKCGKSLVEEEIELIIENMTRDIKKRAVELLGSHEAMISWLTLPAMGLGYRYPRDFFHDVDSLRILDELLTRMEYGVYT